MTPPVRLPPIVCEVISQNLIDSDGDGRLTLREIDVGIGTLNRDISEIERESHNIYGPKATEAKRTKLAEIPRLKTACEALRNLWSRAVRSPDGVVFVPEADVGKTTVQRLTALLARQDGRLTVAEIARGKEKLEALRDNGGNEKEHVEALAALRKLQDHDRKVNLKDMERAVTALNRAAGVLVAVLRKRSDWKDALLGNQTTLLRSFVRRALDEKEHVCLAEMLSSDPELAGCLSVAQQLEVVVDLGNLLATLDVKVKLSQQETETIKEAIVELDDWRAHVGSPLVVRASTLQLLKDHVDGSVFERCLSVGDLAVLEGEARAVVTQAESLERAAAGANDDSASKLNDSEAAKMLAEAEQLRAEAKALRDDLRLLRVAAGTMMSSSKKPLSSRAVVCPRPKQQQ